MNPQEPKYGIHAGEFETSIMLALDPERVREDKLNCEYPNFPSEKFALENADATIAWKTSDFQKSGTFQNGRLILCIFHIKIDLFFIMIKFCTLFENIFFIFSHL